MVKYIKGKNRLKDLIYIQENKPMNGKSVDEVIRAMALPLFENPEAKGIVLYNFKDKNKYDGMLKRLKYTSVDVYDLCNNSDLIKEDIWEDTEFFYVLTNRYGASFVFDFKIANVPNFAEYYLLYNSVSLRNSFEIFEENCKTDISAYKEEYKPDRRDNAMMNLSIRSLVDFIADSNNEEMLVDIERNLLTDEDDSIKRLEFVNTKTRYVSHEIRNQLSICELYTNIVSKHLELKDDYDYSDAILSIKTAIGIANNALIDLKSLDNKNLQVHNTKTLIEKAITLSKIYANNKNISIKFNCKDKDSSIFADESKFLAVLINLIKNSIEAIEDVGEITVTSSLKNDFVSIIVSNNGKKIPDDIQSKIFEDGFTTKAEGSGVGLYICKRTLEEQFAKLELLKSDDKSTDFEILISAV